MSTTDIEKKSLEAHVELCAERYASLDDKLNNLEQRTSKIESLLGEIKEKLFSTERKQKEQFLSWSTKIIAFLVAACVSLATYIFTSLDNKVNSQVTAQPPAAHTQKK